MPNSLTFVHKTNEVKKLVKYNKTRHQVTELLGSIADLSQPGVGSLACEAGRHFPGQGDGAERGSDPHEHILQKWLLFNSFKGQMLT